MKQFSNASGDDDSRLQKQPSAGLPLVARLSLTFRKPLEETNKLFLLRMKPSKSGLYIVQQDLTEFGVVVRSDPGQEKIDLMAQHVGHVISQTELRCLKMWDED